MEITVTNVEVTVAVIHQRQVHCTMCYHQQEHISTCRSVWGVGSGPGGKTKLSVNMSTPIRYIHRTPGILT